MAEQKKIIKSRFRNDILLICLLLIISAAGILYMFVFRSSGDTVKVTVDGELYGIYSLSEDTVVNIITGKDGSSFNLLVISDGKAQIESASCPDGICAAHRPIHRNGESIICLPNRVVVSVFTDDDSAEADIVA